GVSRIAVVAAALGPSSNVRYAARRPRGPRPIDRPNSGLFGSYVAYAQTPSPAPVASRGTKTMRELTQDSRCAGWARDRPKKSPRVGTIGRPGALHTGYPEPGDCSLRSSSCHRRLTDTPPA